jgi:N-acetylglucosamine kinase-like BadF-type ATPase
VTFLGVDGGGTKTAFCLVAADGTVRARIRTRSLDWLSRGPEHVEAVLAEGIPAVCAAAGTEPAGLSFAFFGIPAYGEVGGALAALDAAPRAPLGHDRYACDNDMVAGWAGSLGARDGINVVSGTGSIAYGEHAGGRARAGGWGEGFGDEGSAHWIATRLLNAFSRMSDGREEPTALLDVVRERLELAEDVDLIELVLGRWQRERSKVASLAPLAVEAAERGDPAATSILAGAGEELARLVHAIAERAHFPQDEPIAVSYSGGVFAAGARVIEPFERALPDRCELRTPLLPPHVGAALYAAKLDGHPLDDAALARLRDS